MVKKKVHYRSPESVILESYCEDLLCQSRSSEQLDEPVNWDSSNLWT